jgi:DNA mismatch repair protein MutL
LEDIIQLLPDHISNKIAAGEVIQRPASAVKELIENSLDAGAKSIKLLVKDSGKTLLQVIDDGKGMSPTDARLCFEKHATSKIKNVEDIFKIHSKGFRGEALASIAAVAQVELKTRRPGDEVGTKIVIEGSRVISQEPISMPVGTHFSMKNLFFNIPARRNFLKTDNEEMRQIIIEFDRLALSHCDIEFSLYHNDSEVYKLLPAPLRQRVVSLFGKNYNEKLVNIEEESTDILKIYGFVSKPDAANSKTKGKQYLFVNKRFIKNNYIQHAIYSAYKDLIGEKEYPFYVLFVEIDPAKIDVNVSPTKQEIKFEDEQLIYQFINAGIRRSLMQFNIAPSIDFSVDRDLSHFDAMIKPIKREEYVTENKSSISINRPNFASPKVNNQGNWEELFKRSVDEMRQENDEIISAPKLFEEEAKTFEKTGKPFQLNNKYIVLPTKSALLFIDQKRAHERILFDELQRMSLKHAIPSQRLLFPIVVELSMQDSFVLSEILTDLAHLGFDIAQLGQNNFAIQGIPSDLQMGNEKEMITELIEQFKNSFKAKSSRKEHLLISICKISSVKKKQELSDKEMEYLTDTLFECENYLKSPSGKSIFFAMNYFDIDKNFD